MTIPAATQDRTLSDSGGRRSNQETMTATIMRVARNRLGREPASKTYNRAVDTATTNRSLVGCSRSRDQNSTDQEADVEPGQGHQMGESSGAHSPGDRPWQPV